MDSLQDEVKAALRSTDRLKLRASSDRCGISTTTKTSTAQLRRNLQQWLEDVDGLVLPPRCSAASRILGRGFRPSSPGLRVGRLLGRPDVP